MNKMFLSLKNFIWENKFRWKTIPSLGALTVPMYFLFSHILSQQSGFISQVINLGFVGLADNWLFYYA